MAWHNGITPLAWSPLAGGVLAGKYTREDLDISNEDDSPRKQGTKVMGQLNKRSLQIVDVLKQIAKETKRSPSQVSLNWLLQQPSRPIPIVGARKLSHLEDNLGALDFVLTTEQLERLDRVSSFPMPFPHNFIATDMYQGVIDGENTIENGFTVYR